MVCLIFCFASRVTWTNQNRIYKHVAASVLTLLTLMAFNLQNIIKHKLYHLTNINILKIIKRHTRDIPLLLFIKI